MFFSFFFISYAHICTCIRRHLKESVPWSNITWSGMGKENVQARDQEVHLAGLILQCRSLTLKLDVHFLIQRSRHIIIIIIIIINILLTSVL